jgi:hypothetical protein
MHPCVGWPLQLPPLWDEAPPLVLCRSQPPPTIRLHTHVIEDFTHTHPPTQSETEKTREETAESTCGRELSREGAEEELRLGQGRNGRDDGLDDAPQFALRVQRVQLCESATRCPTAAFAPSMSRHMGMLYCVSVADSATECRRRRYLHEMAENV